MLEEGAFVEVEEALETEFGSLTEVEEAALERAFVAVLSCARWDVALSAGDSASVVRFVADCEAGSLEAPVEMLVEDVEAPAEAEEAPRECLPECRYSLSKNRLRFMSLLVLGSCTVSPLLDGLKRGGEKATLVEVAPPLVVSEKVSLGMLLSFPIDVDNVGEEESMDVEEIEVREEVSSNFEGVEGTEPEEREKPLL